MLTHAVCLAVGPLSWDPPAGGAPMGGGPTGGNGMDQPIQFERSALNSMSQGVSLDGRAQPFDAAQFGRKPFVAQFGAGPDT